MNKERLLELADVIENGYAQVHGKIAVFEMGHWLYTGRYELESFTGFESFEELLESFKDSRPDLKEVNTCGTVGCIAGFTVLLFTQSKDNYGVRHFAQELLELHEEIADQLFLPRHFQESMDKITGPQAAKVIRNLVETGEVDWSEVYQDHFAKGWLDWDPTDPPDDMIYND